MAIDNRLQVFNEEGQSVDYDILASDVKFLPDGKDLPTKLAEMEAHQGDGTVTGVKVGSTPYNPDSNGVVDLSTPFGGKVDKVDGKGLSKNDYTDADKAKLDNLKTVATSGSYNDLIDKPVIPEGATPDQSLDPNSDNAVSNAAVCAGLSSKANDNAVVKSISVNGGTAQTPTEGNVNIQVQAGDQVSVIQPDPADGTFIIRVGSTDYTINLNHEHEGMVKLEKVTAETLPHTLDNDIIYVQVDNLTTPSEIEALHIFGLEFTGGGGYAPGTPHLVNPTLSQISNGINIGYTVNGVATYSLKIKAKDITQPLIVEWGDGSTGYSFDTTDTTTASYYDSNTGKLTIPVADATSINGVYIAVKYTGNADNAEGLLGISSSSVDGINVELPLIVNKVTYEDLAGVMLTGTQWILTDYKPNRKTQFVLNCDFDVNANSDSPSARYEILSCPQNTGDGKRFRLYNGVYDNNYQGEYTLYFINESSIYNGAEQSANMQKLNFAGSASDKTAFLADGAVISYSFQSGASSGTIQMVAGGVTKSHSTSLKSSDMEGELAIGCSQSGTSIYNIFNLTIHSFIITEDGSEVRHWVPKIKDGTPGLYDTINKTFISSQVEGAPLVPVYPQNNN